MEYEHKIKINIAMIYKEIKKHI